MAVQTCELDTWDGSILLQRRSLDLDLIAVGSTVLGSSDPHRLGEILKDLNGGLPVDAGIRDADALLQARGALRRHLLVAFVDIGLDHDADDGLLALPQLVADDLGHLGLVSVVLARVACCVSVSKRLDQRDGSRRTHRASSQS